MKTPQKKVLVTGGAGYIGSVLCRQLLQAGYKVKVIDSLKFGGESLIPLVNNDDFEFIKGDIRSNELLKASLIGVNYVVHLAAIVGDPACKLFEQEATEVNKTASENLFRLSEEANIERFIFASTCSNYGRMIGGEIKDENGTLNPQSHYARLKVAFEKLLLERKNKFVSTSLRFATVYGGSPRVRFDLSVNHFVRDLWAREELIVFGADKWRPYCHVEDLARSVLHVLAAPVDIVNGEVFNVGDTQENYSKQDLIDAIKKVLPNANVRLDNRVIDDPRDYKVNFDKIAQQLDYKITKTVPNGIQEIFKLLESGLIEDPFAQKYQNIPK